MHQWSPELYKKAWHFATLAHDGQSYGSAQVGKRIPYINHIASVAMEVIHALPASPPDVDANLAVQCALLHDTIEDTNTTYQIIKTTFGEAVAKGVQALSKNEQLASKQAMMQDSLERIQQQPKAVWLVKLADRISNLYQPPHYWDRTKKQAYQEEAQLIYDALASANSQLANRLQNKINEYSAFF